KKPKWIFGFGSMPRESRLGTQSI
ncbi:hypothetical protein HMPREF1208_01218, partial [Staphylococcus sp. HGB0015]